MKRWPVLLGHCRRLGEAFCASCFLLYFFSLVTFVCGNSWIAVRQEAKDVAYEL